jgi:hypothetical protein
MERIFRPEDLPMGRRCVCRGGMKRIFRPADLAVCVCAGLE